MDTSRSLFLSLDFLHFPTRPFIFPSIMIFFFISVNSSITPHPYPAKTNFSHLLPTSSVYTLKIITKPVSRTDFTVFQFFLTHLQPFFFHLHVYYYSHFIPSTCLSRVQHVLSVHDLFCLIPFSFFFFCTQVVLISLFLQVFDTSLLLSVIVFKFHEAIISFPYIPSSISGEASLEQLDPGVSTPPVLA